MKDIKVKADDCCASPGLISVEQAIEKILAHAKPIGQVEQVDILDALNRVLAEDLHSTIDVPGYDNSAMDGYAVHSIDCQTSGSMLPVTQRIAAGQIGTALETGSAARIFTGAPVPEGADAVVMQEMCQQHGDEDQGHKVTVNTVVESGCNIRRAGEDIAKDGVVLNAGKRLRAQELGLLASVGLAEFEVKRRLKVAIFFTGDEIVSPGQPLAPGQIYNSNRYTLRGLLQAMDCEVIDLGIVPDTLEATIDVLKQAAVGTDLVITSGGVSVGEEDYVRIALEELGELSMWRIAMKPGKPVAFGKVENALFMGLPGNPVSVFVTFLLFARALILKLQGAEDYRVKPVTVIADFDWHKVKRQEYLRVRLMQKADRMLAQLYPHQGSGVLSSASWADGLVEVKIDTEIKKGDQVSYLSFQGLL
ncbi:MAG: molybdopterin molybdotransferase MoeA [Gammaproteobacteria bacterium]|nr:molybdopterin molybdotransferase MoeA [Gammaproteobacteria bacterium]MBT8134311.1 molybdopterin molybdotransferase MoeA [Gammaproteobacteria bacterium]NNJ50252.1 molybdopterin molybdotransferase MoeA [Gammaproteobacteria bacterium]